MNVFLGFCIFGPIEGVTPLGLLFPRAVSGPYYHPSCVSPDIIKGSSEFPIAWLFSLGRLILKYLRGHDRHVDTLRRLPH